MTCCVRGFCYCSIYFIFCEKIINVICEIVPFDTFVCLIAVTWLLIVMFDNPFVNVLEQHMVLFLIE